MSSDQILAYLAKNVMSVAALALSVSGFFWNRQHTNRTFEASNYPVLRHNVRARWQRDDEALPFHVDAMFDLSIAMIEAELAWVERFIRELQSSSPRPQQGVRNRG